MPDAGPRSPVAGAPGAPGAARDPLFDRLFAEHFTYVWNALRRLGVREGDREDLAQEVFVRVHRALPSYDDGRPPRPWLFAFAFRVASDYRRLARHRVEVDQPPEEQPAIAAGADESLDAARRRALLERGLDALDVAKRAVVILHDLEEMPVPEIARTLEIPEGTAASRLRAGRAELAAAIRRAAKERRRS
jgi:RNA polymerase sigma-70 factor (ECF subfamily)